MKYILLLLAMSLFLNAQENIEQLNKMTVKQMAEFITSTVGSKLPKRLDDIVVIKSVSSNNNTYELKKYISPKDKEAEKKFKRYLSNELYEQQKFYDFVKLNELKNICNSTLLRIFLNKDGLIKIDYYDVNEESILFVLINKKDCS